MNSANFFSGGIYSIKSNITGYFNLREQNDLLVDENMRLRALLDVQEDSVIDDIDSTNTINPFVYLDAKVINNSYSKTKNRITINAGSKDIIRVDMGVITSKGIIGIINSISHNYATVQTILNTDSQINARLKKTNHFGTLKWDTKNPNIVQLTEIPRIAPVSLGDTIVTDGKSTIFPEGILIGTVQKFDLIEDEDYYQIDVKLFNDMTSLNHVYVIENRAKEEIQQLENDLEDVE